MIIVNANNKKHKYYHKDLFTNELVECSEKDFEEEVIKFRHLYEVKYEGTNKQLFLRKGIVEAVRKTTN